MSAGAHRMNHEVHRRSAVQLARLLATRELSVATLTAALIERSAALDTSLHAWVWLDAKRAQREARALDARVAAGLLHGVPIAVKDNIDTAGIATSYGSPIYAGHVPQLDAACVSLARVAGAWVLGKTVSTELANMTPGPTRNPHNLEHTPGGSSSGSAAAVAAGLAPLALGTQTAGSIIRPAAFCGIVGYKPSPRRIARASVKPNSDTLDEVGVLARSVDDAALLGLALTGRPGANLASAQAFAPRVGMTPTSRAAMASAPTIAMLSATAQRLSAGGAVVRELSWPACFDALFDAQRTVQCYETARALAAEWQYRRAQLSAELASFLDEGLRTAGEVYREALATLQPAHAALDALYTEHDVIIAPAAAGAAPRGLASTGDPVFNRPWQWLGCPCVALPTEHREDGLPLGVQLIGRPGLDEKLLAAAAWIEARVGFAGAVTQPAK